MKVINLALKKIDLDRQIEVTLKTKEGTYVFEFGKLTARQLMRAIFLTVGIDSRVEKNRNRKPTWLD